MNWESVPDGTKYRHEDGTIWIKEYGDFFRCPEKNITAAPFQTPTLLSSGKFTLLNDD